MARRVVTVAFVSALLASTTSAAAQGRAPRSPSDRAVDLRQGTPDLALDSRQASAGPTSRDAVSTGWSDTATGGVLIGFGTLFLAGSAVTTALAVDEASSAPADPLVDDDTSGTTTGLAIGAIASGVIGLGLLVPGIVLVATDDGEPVATVRPGPLAGALVVRF